MSTIDTVTLNIHVDVSGFVAAMDGVRRTAIATAEHVARLAYLHQDTEALERRQRRLRTHVWEHPAASRMHAAYTTKTRRRNRR